jgi:membrane-associated phospholipid phosphatase
MNGSTPTPGNGTDRDSRLRVLSAVGMVVLLLLSVAWPMPVIWLNDRTIDAPLAINESSFLGREAPSWDLVFWAIAGLYALSLVHAGFANIRMAATELRSDLKEVPRRLQRRIRSIPILPVLLFLIASATVVSVTWLFFDGVLVVFAEAARTDGAKPFVRLMNRLGGGMNPAMIVLFFLLAGLAFGERRWWRYSLAMAAAGASSGLIAQLVKLAIDRSRPEMWLGPFFFAESASTSFPSGHTVGAFALAGVLLFGARAMPLRVSALAFAVAIAVSRVIGFRHWTSDVVASALMGLLLGWFFATALIREAEVVAVDVEMPGELPARRLSPAAGAAARERAASS